MTVYVGDARLPERFWDKVVVRSSPVMDQPCWVWLGFVNPKGYGRFSAKREDGVRKFFFAHRYSYEQLVGRIPDGLVIDHLCRVRPCVNPIHLEPVPSQTNTLRGESVMAQNAVKTHCKHGHEFTSKNTYLTSRGRQCRQCKEIGNQKFRRARRARERSERQATSVSSFAGGERNG